MTLCVFDYGCIAVQESVAVVRAGYNGRIKKTLKEEWPAWGRCALRSVFMRGQIFFALHVIRLLMKNSV
jgi:hypothetical protein